MNKSLTCENYKAELLEILKVITKHFTKSLEVITFTIRDIRLNSDHM